MLHAQTLDLFKVIVLDATQERDAVVYLSEITNGYVTNFSPNLAQKRALSLFFKPLPITTLFTVEERSNSESYQLLSKQIFHYIEVYGLKSPGLFDLEVRDGKTVVVGNVRGVTDAELGDMVRELLYANKPIRKLDDLIEIILFHKIAYDIALVANNEARIRLYVDGDKFASGDDAVRYIVYKAMDDSLLIKSPKVIAAVKANASRIPLTFLIRHEAELAQVWNRHKRIIMSLKTNKNKSVINRISRLSKTLHVPIRQAINKTFIAQALKGEIKAAGIVKALHENISLRDKFKYLNLIEWRMLGRTDDVFIVRNGRAHLENDRPVWTADHLEKLNGVVLASIEEDLQHLKGKRILLDQDVNYGLPTSQKQMLGNLPFGTEISVDGDRISTGIYWHNDDGASDLDLSCVDDRGNRTGWGGYAAYNNKHHIAFSGDITYADNGAMEFVTTKKDYERPYGIYVNIFTGLNGAKASLVIGHQTEKKWINNPVVREEFKLPAKQSILGFVRNGKFVTYALSTSNSPVSGSEINKRLIAKALAPMWTVKGLLDAMDIKYDTTAVRLEKAYDFDLSYASFSIDKLEKMLFNK